MTFYKPKIFVSKCIGGEACRYDGSMINSSFVERITPYVDIIRECPERSIGLPVPREAIRIIERNNQELLVYSMTGEDVTLKMNQFAKFYTQILLKQNIHGFILKNRSPSCGLKDVKVYNKIGKAMALDKKTSGFFGREVVSKFPFYPVENEGRLRNFDIRDHFLTQIYTLSYFDHIKKTMQMNELVQFHSENKYLLMAYNQEEAHKLGGIVANHEALTVEACYDLYFLHLRMALHQLPKKGRNINMLQHVKGYFSNDLTQEEKMYFDNLVALYKKGKLPYQVPREVLRSWAIHYDKAYLKQQTFFNPYPEEILDLLDSGKGRK